MSKKSEKSFELLLPRGDSFFWGRAEYLYNENFGQVRNFFGKRVYTAEKTGVPYRVISHWDTMGLLPENDKDSGEWRKFNFIEVVWLRVISHLRKFGVPLEQILALKNTIMRWDDEAVNYHPFDYYVCLAWFNTSDPYVLLLSNGKSDVATSSEIEFGKGFLGSVDMLLVSLKCVLQEMGIKKVANANMLYALTDAEVNLLAGIRNESNNGLNLKVDGEGAITEIERERKITNPQRAYEANYEIKGKGGFGQVIKDFENGKPTGQTIKIKQKFKKKTLSEKPRHLSK
jgi:hypothetical protein